MAKHRSLLAGLLFALAPAFAMGFAEREVAFSEADIQIALDRAKPLQLAFGPLLALRMDTPPRISLAGNDGRAGLSAALDVETQGQPPLRVDVAGRTGIRYDDREKAFFLDKPTIETISAPALSTEATPMLRQAISQLLQHHFRRQPVYVLRENGSPQEATARWLLKSVRIEPGRIVAVLSPI